LGWKKPNIYNWFLVFLWVFVVLDVISTIRGYYNKFIKKEDEEPAKKNPTFRPKLKVKKEEESE